MGINGLLPFIKRFGKQYNIRVFSGKKAAIDASCWLHKGLYVSMNYKGDREMWVNVSRFPICCHLNYDFIVFYWTVFFTSRLLLMLTFDIVQRSSRDSSIFSKISALNQSWCLMAYLCQQKRQNVNVEKGTKENSKHLISFTTSLIQYSYCMMFRVAQIFNYNVFIIIITRQRESLLARASGSNVTEEAARKLKSQAMSIQFEDIVTCIRVSLLHWNPSSSTSVLQLGY